MFRTPLAGRQEVKEPVRRWIGVDVGRVRVGLAVTDESVGIPLPHATLAPTEAIEEILDLVEEQS